MKKIEIDEWILNFFKECDLKRLYEIKRNYEREYDILVEVIKAKENQWIEGTLNEDTEQSNLS